MINPETSSIANDFALGTYGSVASLSEAWQSLKKKDFFTFLFALEKAGRFFVMPANTKAILQITYDKKKRNGLDFNHAVGGTAGLLLDGGSLALSYAVSSILFPDNIKSSIFAIGIMAASRLVVNPLEMVVAGRVQKIYKRRILKR